MVDFRKQAKDNPLRPNRVIIPQLDPLTEINHYDASRDSKDQQPEPEQTGSVNGSNDNPPVNNSTAPKPQNDSGGLDSYKDKYLSKDADKVSKTYHMYRWRHDQLEKEVHETGLKYWQIIDIALEMYFRTKQSRKQDQ